MTPCEKCKGHGSTAVCWQCEGSGDCTDCDCGQPHSCGQCHGVGKLREPEACTECEGCGSVDALDEWREERAKSSLPTATQKALCEAAMVSTAARPLIWRGGELHMRGIPAAVVALVPGAKHDFPDGKTVAYVNRETPDPDWTKRTLARVQKELV